MGDRRDRGRLPRQLWGVDPHEVEELLADLEAPLQRERMALEQIVTTLEAEERQLTADLLDLTQRVELAQERQVILRRSLEQQRTSRRAHGLALTRELTRREQEHRGELDLLHRQREALRQEIDQRRQSLHAWVTELLASLAARGRL